MSKRKPGQWWDKSWSVVTGCTPAGAGCDHCWARALVRRFPAAHGVQFMADCDGPDPAIPFGQVLCHPVRLGIPGRTSRPTVWAVSLLGDLFHPDVPDEFIGDAVIGAAAYGHHRFVFCTKRWHRAAALLIHNSQPGGQMPPARQWNANCIIMASVWDQDSTNAACAALADVQTRWGLGMEPLLGPVDFRLTVTNKIGSSLPAWVIVGAENGPGKRPCDPAWIASIEQQCRNAGVPCWRKAADGPKEVPW